MVKQNLVGKPNFVSKVISELHIYLLGIFLASNHHTSAKDIEAVQILAFLWLGHASVFQNDS